MYSHILFDLDGTLTDSRLGITKSVAHALVAEGYPAPKLEELTWVVGPPLRESFLKLVDSTDAAVAERLLAQYRKRFEPIGMFENEVYDGIRDVLKALVDHSCHLHLATSKPRIYAERILEHFSLAPFFETVAGAELDGSIESKDDVIRTVLETAHLDKAACIMIGDREHDVHGAAANGIPCVGVTYGFGEKSELLAAGARCIVDSPRALVPLLTGAQRFD
ncbi:HAD hydrolase-like protein [Alicyclobacillus fastidiosus]|uniref:HAD hydrolase-like protein n=1 Tax=Alicyclobacillus fastidiosus TaxID=392011 RepID=A0ABY6ZEB8_9BACL|nr:HAD hydrolase-like protein [Alicyclobacillus fastidiosus]WAH40893.1 HAD hydrolase-like protein [Alicyclobacillus fastidiosus]GMA62384.1 phosphoglycolate phosphatase [Alicyclobacillus fastidiosus]